MKVVLFEIYKDGRPVIRYQSNPLTTDEMQGLINKLEDLIAQEKASQPRGLK